MSLLLDALKRAEDAKRAKAEAAAQLATGGDAVGLGEPAALEVNAVGSSGGAPNAPSGTQQLETPAVHRGEPTYPTLSLEDLDAPHSGEDSVKSSVQTSEQNTAEPPVPILSLDDLLESELGPSARKSAPPLPTPRATAAFRATRAQSTSRPELELVDASAVEPPSQPVSQSAVSPSALQPISPPAYQPIKQPAVAAPIFQPPAPETPELLANREAVKNVFAVKQTLPNRKLLTWTIPTAGVLAIAIGWGGWYVWNEVNRLARPTIAGGPIPRPTPQPTPAPVAPNPPSQVAVAGPLPPPVKPEPAAQSAEAPEGEKKKSAVATQEVVPVPLPPLLPPPAIKIKEERQVASANVIAATPREAMARRVDALPAERNGGSNAERVTLRPAATIIAQISPALSAGYAALATGDYANAKRYYAEAISTNSNSADAHLGFATANARSGSPGDSALAIRHYERVLEIDPRNSTARAALLVMGASKSVGGPGNSLTSGEKEAELKLLIAQDPAAANLHFLLGNFYADARRWSEAQQAYFEAARLVPQNGDYCFNLGVSLDQLGQAASAVTFYRRALAATIKGQFEPDVVQRRIAALTAISKPRTGQ